ncbi:MAG TPA: helix-turn-helix transcriptional regulator [Candidatus Eremiobacteraceae bacterium]|nr:helix-turn-helix transcriptional regulator [Candidatus Eremiobacteraceae bacterium]
MNKLTGRTRQAKTKPKLSEQEAFGLAVRERRLELGVSQEGLGELARLHRTYVGSIERGERNVSLRNIFAIASALRIQPSDLMSEAESRTLI